MPNAGSTASILAVARGGPSAACTSARASSSLRRLAATRSRTAASAAPELPATSQAAATARSPSAPGRSPQRRSAPAMSPPSRAAATTGASSGLDAHDRSTAVSAGRPARQLGRQGVAERQHRPLLVEPLATQPGESDHLAHDDRDQRAHEDHEEDSPVASAQGEQHAASRDQQPQPQRHVTYSGAVGGSASTRTQTADGRPATGQQEEHAAEHRNSRGERFMAASGDESRRSRAPELRDPDSGGSLRRRARLEAPGRDRGRHGPGRRSH